MAGLFTPTWVVLYKQLDGKWTRYSQLVFQQPGPYEFLCLAGKYTLVAFEDQNEAWVLQPHKPAARLGSKEGITLLSGQPLDSVDLTLGTLREPLGFEVALARSDETVTDELVKVHAGDLATIEDERFSPQAGQLADPPQAKRQVGLSRQAPAAPTGACGEVQSLRWFARPYRPWATSVSCRPWWRRRWKRARAGPGGGRSGGGQGARSPGGGLARADAGVGDPERQLQLVAGGQDGDELGLLHGLADHSFRRQAGLPR